MKIPEPPANPPGAWSNWDEVMRLALEQARLAAGSGEVPVGAALLDADGALVTRAHNAPITTTDPTGHAEIRCLRAGALALNNYRLTGCILVVTLEPCLMCVGALIHARVAGVVYGASDNKAGAVDSCLQASTLPFVNHRFWVVPGVLSEDCGTLLSSFFAARRGRSSGAPSESP